ncbi:MAG TPA: sulfate ABC transporter permease subunit [Blastocatellia bacterium]|jgi:sulfate transport system permease protein|nr:sulfate ABC transporter permease subunit [Blastocatellia bacterium]
MSQIEAQDAGAAAPYPPEAVLPPARSSKSAARAQIVEYALIALVLLYAAGLLVGPLVAIFWSALAEGAGGFIREVTSADAVASLKLTLILAVAATAVNTAFGMCVAWVLVRDDFRGKRIINGLVDMPFAVSPVIAGFMLILLFGRNGWLTPVIDALGIKVVFALPGMLLATIFISLPFVIREVMPVLAQVSADQEDAAYTMGASRWQTFRRVTLPAIKWGLFYGVSLTFARAVGEIGAVLVVSGGVSRLTETSTLFIFRSLDDRNYVGANAMAVVLAAISFVVLMVIEFLKKRTEES